MVGGAVVRKFSENKKMTENIIDKYKRNLKKRLVANDIELVFGALTNDIYEQSRCFHSILVNKFRLSQIKVENIKGVLAHDEYSRQMAKIVSATFEIIDELSEQDLKKEFINIDSIFRFEDVCDFITGRFSDLNVKLHTTNSKKRIQAEIEGNKLIKSETTITYNEFECLGTGEFSIQYSMDLHDRIEFDSKHKIYDHHDWRKEVLLITGNLRDISNVALIKNKDYDDSNLESLRLYCYNGRPNVKVFNDWTGKSCFMIENQQKIELTSGNKEIVHENKVDLLLDGENEMKNRLLNAFNYLLEHFGSKREVF